MMKDLHEAYQHLRAMMLTGFLLVFFGGMILLFLVALTGGAFLLIPIGVGLMLALGAFHYLLWGKSFTQDTEIEREVEQLRQESETDEWEVPAFRHTRRF